MGQQISASILSSNITKLGDEVQAVHAAGADYIHLDIMDNHYVPNLTFGPLVCQGLHNNYPFLKLDVHIMASPVDGLIGEFADAGAYAITIHPDCTHHLDRSLHLIKEKGCLSGLAFNPSTSLNDLKYVIDKVDWILIMSVNPGFGGQTFIPAILNKIQEAHELIQRANRKIKIAVDGGITLENVEAISKAGADIFVIGSTLFKSYDYSLTLQTIKNKLK